MPLRFRCYTDNAGHDVIRDWYEARDVEARANIIGVLWALEERSTACQDENLFKELKKQASSKNCAGFHEILIDYDDKELRNITHHYRIIGYLERDTFTMLTAVYKNDDGKYKEPCRVAKERLAEISVDRRRSGAWDPTR